MLATGEGAFDLLARAVTALRKVEDEINAAVADPDFAATRERPYGMSVGKIEGGVWTASTPYELTAYVRFGFGPETLPEEIQARMRTAVRRRHRPSRSTSRATGRAPTTTRSPVHSSSFSAASHEHVTGTPLAPLVNTGTVDTRYVETVPGYCYGAIGDNLHGTDEWVDLDSLVRVATVVAITTAGWTA